MWTVEQASSLANKVACSRCKMSPQDSCSSWHRSQLVPTGQIAIAHRAHASGHKFANHLWPSPLSYRTLHWTLHHIGPCYLPAWLIARLSISQGAYLGAIWYFRGNNAQALLLRQRHVQVDRAPTRRTRPLPMATQANNTNRPQHNLCVLLQLQLVAANC